ncbi:MAG: hypothetical protein VB078_10300 [Clostridiaceae bacterium]|nr:hypothetical protein [Clostridiaceae bacterium]
MTDCPLYLNDREIGRVRWSEEKDDVLIWASCPFEKDYIYRVYIGDEEDDRKLYAGIMMPERGRFIVTKKMPRSKCAFLFSELSLSAVVVRRLPGEDESTPPLPISFSQLRPVKQGETGCDSFVEGIYAKCNGLYAESKGITYFVAPAELGAELGPTPFFCLLTWFRHVEKGYCVLCVDEKGKLFPIGQKY